MTRPEIPHTSNARDGLGPTRQNNSVLGAFGIGSKKNGGVADPAHQLSCRPLSESGDDVFFLLFFLKGTDNPQWSIGKKNSSVEPPTDLLSGEAIRTVWGGGHE